MVVKEKSIELLVIAKALFSLYFLLIVPFLVVKNSWSKSMVKPVLIRLLIINIPFILKPVNWFGGVTEAATRGVLWKELFLEISQNSQENTCVRISFLLKLQASGQIKN